MLFNTDTLSLWKHIESTYFNYFLNCPVLTVTIKQIIIIALLLHKIILILNKTRNGNRPNDLDRPLYRSIQLYKSISFRFYF